MYKFIKQNENEMEYYVSHSDRNVRLILAKFRLSEHKLLIEIGIIPVHVTVLFYVVMYALFLLSVHVYYVNCNAKTQMGYLCALIK